MSQAAIPAPALPRRRNLLAPVLAWWRRMRHAVAGRRALAKMDARMLADIGVSRAEAAREAARRFWDV